MYDGCSAWSDSPPLTDCLWVKGQCRLFSGTQDKKQTEPQVEEESLCIYVVTQPPPQSCYPFTFASCSSGSANNSHSLTFFFSSKTAGCGEATCEQKWQIKVISGQQDGALLGDKVTFLFFECPLQTSGICPRGARGGFTCAFSLNVGKKYIEILASKFQSYLFWIPEVRSFF